jgi:hypothetical protein
VASMKTKGSRTNNGHATRGIGVYIAKNSSMGFVPHIGPARCSKCNSLSTKRNFMTGEITQRCLVCAGMY